VLHDVLSQLPISCSFYVTFGPPFEPLFAVFYVHYFTTSVVCLVA